MNLKLVIGCALLLGGCASPQRIAHGADKLEAQAREADARGDHVRAQEKREAAAREYNKAQNRSAWYY